MSHDQLGLKQLFKSRLGRRQLSYILLFSTIVTITTTIVLLAVDFRTDIHLVERMLNDIEDSQLKSITNSVWKLDQEQIRIQLENMMNLNDIKYISIREGDTILYEAGEPSRRRVISRDYELVVNHLGYPVNIGTLHVIGNLNNVYKRLFRRLLVILSTQTIKTFLVSFFVLFIIYRTVTRHLFQMGQAVNDLDFEKPCDNLKFKKRSSLSDKPDELDSLAESIDRMYQRLCYEYNEKIKASDQIEASLKEKEILLQEVHHRVKNNLQIIASLLNMQTRESEERDIDTILKNNIARVYAMAKIHESFYESDNLSEIDCRTYLSKLAVMLRQAFGIDPDKILLQVDSPEIKLNIEQANPLGLVLNELLSNSIKHAFTDNREGIIKITTRVVDKTKIEITIKDNGVGMPDGFNWKESKRLGLRISKNIIERQLNGSIECKNQNGTQFKIRINLDPVQHQNLSQSSAPVPQTF